MKTITLSKLFSPGSESSGVVSTTKPSNISYTALPVKCRRSVGGVYEDCTLSFVLDYSERRIRLPNRVWVYYSTSVRNCANRGIDPNLVIADVSLKDHPRLQMFHLVL